jgi:hypothetical protein
MDIRENCGIREDGDGGRILPEAANGDGDGEYFRWRGNEK